MHAGSILEVRISLTEEGLSNYDDVLTLVHGYLGQLRRGEGEGMKELFESIA
jgi:secreted Zn-dependent insulinase-like peptidase